MAQLVPFGWAVSHHRREDVPRTAAARPEVIHSLLGGRFRGGPEKLETRLVNPQTRPAALNVTSPFTRADARAAGVSIKSLRSAIYQKLFYDLYVAADVAITPEVWARAALHVAGPGAHASHSTAAQIWGIPVPRDSHTHVTVPDRNDRCVRQGIKSHLRNAGSTTTIRSGVRISTPEQTFLDLAATGMGLVDLVIVGDMMLKADLITIAALIEAVDDWTGPHGRTASRAVRLVRDGVDSPMETRLRLLLVLAGLPEPKVNMIVRAEDGSWRLPFDLCYETYRLIVEYDGRQHADSRDQWSATSIAEKSSTSWVIDSSSSRPTASTPSRSARWSAYATRCGTVAPRASEADSTTTGAATSP